MRFSERFGHRKTKVDIQTDKMDDDLRNGLWSCLKLGIFDNLHNLSSYSMDGNKGYHLMEKLSANLWLNFFKKPIDTCPSNKSYLISFLRDWFFSCKWYDIYDFIGFIIEVHDDAEQVKDFIEGVNIILKRELSGYRIVSSTVTPITSETDLTEIEKAARSPIEEVNEHINRALELLSDRKNPDYRNSIKESISAVETLCKTITKNDKATLGDALSEIQKSKKVEFHGAILSAYKSLYGYTNDAEGIRHSLMEETKLDIEDALFMLVSCSAFINYLIEKSSKSHIKF